MNFLLSRFPKRIPSQIIKNKNKICIMIIWGNDLDFSNIAKKLFFHKEIDALLRYFIDFDRVAVGHAYECLVWSRLLFDFVARIRVTDKFWIFLYFYWMNISSFWAKLVIFMEVVFEHFLFCNNVRYLYTLYWLFIYNFLEILY